MFFNKVTTPHENPDAPKELSLEIIWDAKPYYWGGKIKVMDFYINSALLYSISIPQEPNQTMQPISLPFKKVILNQLVANSDSPYLLIDNLSKVHTIELKVGIFQEQEETLSGQNSDPGLRSNVTMNLNVNSLQLGNHYKIIVNHRLEQQSNSSFWQGKFLDVVIEEDGFCKTTDYVSSESSISGNPFSTNDF